jgi:hypothetical protein
MKLLVPLLIAASLLAPGPPAVAPECTASLMLPDSSQQLSLHWRQVGGDLSHFTEPEGADAAGLHALRVQCLLAQGGQLRNDVPLRVGDATLAPAARPLGFTISAAGGQPRFFLVDGESSVDLASQQVEPGFTAPVLLLQWIYVDRSNVRLHWHLGDRAGAIDFHLAPEPAKPAAAPHRDG